MNLVWFRNDLRLVDNPALYEACLQQQGVQGFVVFCTDQWRQHADAPVRLLFWRKRLQELQQQLHSLNIACSVLVVESYHGIPEAITQFALKLQARALYFNYEYPLNERQRDSNTCNSLAVVGIQAFGFHGDLILPPGKILNGQGDMFKVYTPFARAWRKQYLQQPSIPVGMPVQQQTRCAESDDAMAEQFDSCFAQAQLDLHSWPVDEAAITQRLHAFVETQLQHYKEQRDFPAVSGTSRLSAYLAIGALSARQCLQAVVYTSHSSSWLEGSWVNELIWREFYRHLLVAQPQLSRLEPFRPDVEKRIKWQQDDAAFAAWCNGETGFPLVDAAMKQLLHTGWMHNRLRMVVASFLTKLLRIDWRKGAEFFMSQLIDGDFASNLGGWQWSASVGADAAPYFRIFNPILQSQKFDPSGEFIAYWLPELRHLPAKERHFPRPTAIIDYKTARASSLADYQQTV